MCSSDLGTQRVNDMAIMYDFMPHIDRRAVFYEREFDDLHCAVDPGAKTARGGEQNG